MSIFICLFAFSCSLFRWAGNKAWQKMGRGRWLVRWLGTGMAILSLLTYSWSQDTEGMRSLYIVDHFQASPFIHTARKETYSICKAIIMFPLIWPVLSSTATKKIMCHTSVLCSRINLQNLYKFNGRKSKYLKDFSIKRCQLIQNVLLEIKTETCGLLIIINNLQL